MKVGFIGLGVMGRSMAEHILKAGYELYVYNRTKSKADSLVDMGAVWVDTPKELAQQSEVIITIVGYPKDVEEVYLGEDGIFAGVQEGSVVIDMTTSSPSLAEKLAAKGHELKAGVMDAPVSGGDKGAKEGTLTIMVGGNESDLDKVQPIFEAIGKDIVYHGLHGSGQRAKIVNQIMVAGTMLGMAEVLAFAKETGLSIEKVQATLGGGAASNWSLINYTPRIIQNDYSPGFFVKHFVKDLKIALDEADKLNLDLPMTRLAYELYNQLIEQGYENDGTQAIVKLWWKNH